MVEPNLLKKGKRTKFPNKLTVLIFWTKLTKKWHLRLKSKKVNITTALCIFKLEENNYIFLAGDDALVYMPNHTKKRSTTFAWGHSFPAINYESKMFHLGIAGVLDLLLRCNINCKRQKSYLFTDTKSLTYLSNLSLVYWVKIRH